MASQDIEQRIERFKSSALDIAPKSQVDELKSLMDESLKIENDEHKQRAFELILRVILAENISLVTSRPLLQEFCQVYIDCVSVHAQEKLIGLCLEKLKNRTISYEDQITLLREKLAHICEMQGEWRKAAMALAGIPLETGQRTYTNAYKLQTYIKIARLYLEDDDAIQAENFVKRCAILQQESEDESMKINYQVCMARVLDYKMKFGEAATLFYDLSNIRTIASSEQDECLKRAANATLLSPIGVNRDRMLSVLLKNERIKLFPQYPFLEKMFRGKLIKPEEIILLENELMNHQKTKYHDKMSIPQRAVQEHNIKCLVNIYSSIRFSVLADVLGLELQVAETLLCNMVIEGRLNAKLCQEKGIAYFQEIEDRNDWNKMIENSLEDVNSVYNEIVSMYSKGVLTQ